MELLDENINNLSSKNEEKNLKAKLEYTGESSSLAFSIFILIAIVIVFSSITLGFFALFLIYSLVHFRIQDARLKARYVRISSNNFPKIYNLSKLAAYRLKMPLPPVYIKQDPNLNAYTGGFWGNHWIVLHSAILKQLYPGEILYIIGHEMGHIKKEHSTWLNLMGTQGTPQIFLISDGTRIIFNNWSIRAEYSADRAGLLANMELKSCVSALSMLATEDRNIDIESFLKESYNLQKKSLSGIAELFGTHPYIANRIKNLYNFSKLIHLNH